MATYQRYEAAIYVWINPAHLDGNRKKSKPDYLINEII